MTILQNGADQLRPTDVILTKDEIRDLGLEEAPPSGEVSVEEAALMPRKGSNHG